MGCLYSRRGEGSRMADYAADKDNHTWAARLFPPSNALWDVGPRVPLTILTIPHESSRRQKFCGALLLHVLLGYITVQHSSSQLLRAAGLSIWRRHLSLASPSRRRTRDLSIIWCVLCAPKQDCPKRPYDVLASSLL